MIHKIKARKYLSMAEQEITGYLQDTGRQKMLDKYRGYIEHLLQTYPKLTATKIKRKLEEKIGEETASERTYRNYVVER